MVTNYFREVAGMMNKVLKKNRLSIVKLEHFLFSSVVLLYHTGGKSGRYISMNLLLVTFWVRFYQ